MCDSGGVCGHVRRVGAVQCCCGVSTPHCMPGAVHTGTTYCIYIYIMYIVFIVPIFDMNKCKYAKLTGGVLARVPVLVLVHTFT